MTKEELLTMVAEKKKNLLTSIDMEDEEYLFFSSFLNNNKIARIEDLETINLADLITAFSKCTNPKLSLLELTELSTLTKPLFEQLDSEELFSLFSNLEELIINNSIFSLEQALKEKRLFHKIKKIIGLLNNMQETRDLPKYIISLFLDDELNFQPLLEILKKDTTTIMNSLALATAVKQTIETKRQIKVELDMSVAISGVRISEANKNRYLMKLIKEEPNMKNLLKDMNKINLYAIDLKKKEQNRKRQIKKEIQAYDRLYESFLNQEVNKVILDHHRITDGIADEQIKLEDLKLIYEHNLPYYQELWENYQELSEDTITKYQVLLQEYGVGKDTYSDEDIMKHSLKITKDMLDTLKEFGIINPQQIVSLLTNSTLDYLNAMLTITKKGYITKQLLQQNPNYLIEENNIYDIISQNINSLDDKKLNPELISKDEKSWLIAPELFKHNLDILEESNLLSAMSKTSKYQFLKEESLTEKLEVIEELGYKSFLNQGLDLLNIETNRWNRIKILKLLDMRPDNLSDLQEMLTTDHFFVPDELIEDYLPSTEKTPIKKK